MTTPTLPAHWLVFDDQPNGQRLYLVTGPDGCAIGVTPVPAAATIFFTAGAATRACDTAQGPDTLWFIGPASADPEWTAAVLARGVDALRQDHAAAWPSKASA